MKIQPSNLISILDATVIGNVTKTRIEKWIRAGQLRTYTLTRLVSKPRLLILLERHKIAKERQKLNRLDSSNRMKAYHKRKKELDKLVAEVDSKSIDMIEPI